MKKRIEQNTDPRRGYRNPNADLEHANVPKVGLLGGAKDEVDRFLSGKVPKQRQPKLKQRETPK